MSLISSLTHSINLWLKHVFVLDQGAKIPVLVNNKLTNTGSKFHNVIPCVLALTSIKQIKEVIKHNLGEIQWMIKEHLKVHYWPLRTATYQLKKSNNQHISLGLMLWILSLCAKICAWMQLKSEEKSIKSSCTVVLAPSKCDRDIFNKLLIASSTARPDL